MDQLIPVINWVKKNVFWIVCGVLTIALVTSWILVTNKLDAETKKAQNLYQTKVRTTTNIKGVNAEGVPDEAKAHPNETTVAGMQEEINDSVDVLIQAWQKRLDEQAIVRTWPKSLLENRVFSRTFAAYDPPETFPVTNNGLQMKAMLSLYKETIPKAMNRIAGIIKTKWEYKEDEDDIETSKVDQDGKEEQKDEGNGRGLQSSVDAGADDGPPVVFWNADNQELWNQKLTNFAGRDDNQMGADNLPSPLQVFMLQQDLWLLEAMFNTIANVNTFEVKDADGNVEKKMADATDLAVIKRIDHIAFGREALGQLGEIADPDTRLGRGQTATTTNVTPSSPQGQGQQNAPPGRTRRRPANTANQATDGKLLTLEDLGEDEFNSPFHGRYVDTNLQPIKAEVVRQIFAADKLPNQDLELLIARRIPVRIAFRMDERYVGKFIDECNKSPFTFEINQIRYNKHKPNDGIELQGVGTGFKEDAGGGNKKDGSDLGSSTGSLEGGMGEDESGGDEDDDLGALASPETRTSYDVNVEFFGVIKLYNPIKSKEFLTGQKEPGQNVDAGTPKPGSILP